MVHIQVILLERTHSGSPRLKVKAAVSSRHTAVRNIERTGLTTLLLCRSLANVSQPYLPHSQSLYFHRSGPDCLSDDDCFDLSHIKVIYLRNFCEMYAIRMARVRSPHA
jgi:hypothetical protein